MSTQTKFSIGTQTLVELISQRKLVELKNKLLKAVKKFQCKFECYPDYIENIDDYCERSIKCINKYVLLDDYPSNTLKKLTNLNQIHNYITKTYDSYIKNEIDLDKMWEQYVEYDLNMHWQC